MLSPSAQKVQDALDAFGIQLQVVEMPASTRSAAEAAEAIGFKVEQIAKSLVFRGRQTGRPLLVIASGVNRVDERKIEAQAGEPVAKAVADFVRQRTGFAIGGVPPAGHAECLETFIDEDLLQHLEIWAAAGTSHAVFRLAPAELVKVTQGKVIDLKS